MTSHDDSSDQQTKLYIESVSIVTTHTEVDVCLCCDDEAAKMNVKERNEERSGNMEAFIKYKRPYDDSDDGYFLADIPDNNDINYIKKNNNNYKFNYKINQNNSNNKKDNDKNYNDNVNSNNTKKKEKNTFVSMVCSLLQLKHGIKMM
jgi:hypothetical protein